MVKLCSVYLCREIEYVDIMRSVKYNNIEAILNQHYFDNDYYNFQNLDDFVRNEDVKVVGHFDGIGPTKDPLCYAFERGVPVAGCLLLLDLDGFKEKATTQPWSCTYKNSGKLKEFCENTPFTVYLIKYEERGEGVVLMLYDDLFQTEDGKWHSIALETERKNTLISWASALSCVLPSLENTYEVLYSFFDDPVEEDDWEEEYDDEF